MNTHTFESPQGPISYRTWGSPSAAPLMLLHGFPQTSIMWARVAAQLCAGYFCIAPDLRGYGDSFKPADAAEHAQMSKRAMAQDVVALADHLGVDRFTLIGHDRGGRVAHRLALDHADRLNKLCVIDIAPTLDMYARTDMAFARAYYHWFHLIQPAPLPEMMIGGDAKRYLHAKLGGWGGAGLGVYAPEELAEYERCFTPEAIHTMCEDYRASAGIDLEHDRASRAAGQKIGCDTLVLWGARGVVAKLFDPLALWQAQCAKPVHGQALPGGHFLPEECAAQTIDAIGAWMTA
jgi:haloacetate dehalogenase